jgi:hypothetical protein
MVVVDPDEVARLVYFHDSLGVFVVGLDVCFPLGVVCADFRGDVLPEEIVEERPKRYIMYVLLLHKN